jgi:CheY-like chemotaxis protein/MinD-like ATPase involved in chromosome partitioning or flagellar assembly
MAEKILIVDDDLETLRLVGLTLQRKGYVTISAQSGSEGLRLASAEKPDLIILDLMMPELDGYRVASQLKADPVTASIPILVFTARFQMEDKVKSYEIGAADYLTKPVHPTELITHIKALLARRKAPFTPPVLPASGLKGYVLGFLASKGGMGVSSLALNLGIILEQRMHRDVIAAELRPGQGTWAGEMNFANATGLTNLLTMPVEQINEETVARELVKTTYGIRLLFASSDFRDFNLACRAIPQLETLIETLTRMAHFLILDIGTPFMPGFEKIIRFCNEINLVSEPQAFSLQRTNQLIDELGEIGIQSPKKINVIIVNRVRADLQLSAAQIQEMLGRPIHLVVPPVPEASFHAAVRNVPLAILQPDGIYAQQITRLASHLAETVS